MFGQVWGFEVHWVVLSAYSCLGLTPGVAQEPNGMWGLKQGSLLIMQVLYPLYYFSDLFCYICWGFPSNFRVAPSNGTLSPGLTAPRVAGSHEAALQCRGCLRGMKLGWHLSLKLCAPPAEKAGVLLSGAERDRHSTEGSRGQRRPQGPVMTDPRGLPTADQINDSTGLCASNHSGCARSACPQ